MRKCFEIVCTWDILLGYMYVCMHVYAISVSGSSSYDVHLGMESIESKGRWVNQIRP
jgi:hypothetical protein